MPSLTNITSSRFGHNLDVVILEFILSASGYEVEGTERKHLWGLVLTPLPRDEPSTLGAGPVMRWLEY